MISLDANESSHAVKARRLRVSQVVRVFNGLGLVANGVISVIGRREVMVELQSIEQLMRPQGGVSIAVALPKGDRQKVMVDMLTQLGVVEIIPLRCEHSVTKFSDNTAEKWTRVAIEACKQSQNPWLPKISAETGLDQLLCDERKHFLVANADGAAPQALAQKTSDVTVLIGPEGGFSEQEFATLRQRSIPSIRIGSYILRTEAAAVAAASALINRDRCTAQ